MHTLRIEFDGLWDEPTKSDPILPEGVSFEKPTYSAVGMWTKDANSTSQVVGTLLVTVAGGVSSAIATEIIHRLFANREHKRIRIDEQEVEVEMGQIQRVITRKLSIDE
jgi:hypothetical protein